MYKCLFVCAGKKLECAHKHTVWAQSKRHSDSSRTFRLHNSLNISNFHLVTITTVTTILQQQMDVIYENIYNMYVYIETCAQVIMSAAISFYCCCQWLCELIVVVRCLLVLFVVCCVILHYSLSLSVVRFTHSCQCSPFVAFCLLLLRGYFAATSPVIAVLWRVKLSSDEKRNSENIMKCLFLFFSNIEILIYKRKILRENINKEIYQLKNKK